MSYKVFISSTRDDLELARDLAQRLEAAGIRVYPVDQTAVPAEKIVTGVNKSLSEADEVMLIMTRASGDSPGLISEMGKAFALKKHVTPVLVNLESENIPPMLKEVETVKYADLPKYISRLADRLIPREVAVK